MVALDARDIARSARGISHSSAASLYPLLRRSVCNFGHEQTAVRRIKRISVRKRELPVFGVDCSLFHTLIVVFHPGAAVKP